MNAFLPSILERKGEHCDEHCAINFVGCLNEPMVAEPRFAIRIRTADRVALYAR